MHRRQFLTTVTLAAATPMAIAPALAAQDATPASDDASLAERVAALAPEALLEALLTTPLTTPLVPADLAGVAATIWDDTNDSDLAGAVGGVSFAVPSSGSEVPVGSAIVQPNADAAQATLRGLPPLAFSSEFLGLPWITLGYNDYAISAVMIDYLILAGGPESSWDTGADPDAATGRKLRIRAIDNMVMLVDHLDDVLTALGA